MAKKQAKTAPKTKRKASPKAVEKIKTIAKRATELQQKAGYDEETTTKKTCKLKRTEATKQAAKQLKAEGKI